MEERNLKGCACAYATPKSDGNLFWQTAIYDGENDSHYFFLVNGSLMAILRSNVLKIEFKGVV
jgi:hypothetical protein